MPWFLVECQGLTYDGTDFFPTGSRAYSEGESVEERAKKWGLLKQDPKLGLPDLFYLEKLTPREMARRDLEDIQTSAYSIKPVDAPVDGVFVCGGSLLCTIPITIGVL